MNLETVIYEVKDSIARITMNRPDKKNALILKARLQKRYSKVYITEYNASSQIYYRVRIRTRSMKAAQRIAESLTRKGYSAHILEEY